MKILKPFIAVGILLCFMTSCNNQPKSVSTSNDELAEVKLQDSKIEQEEVYYTILIWYKNVNKLREFEQKATPYFQKYGISFVRVINELNPIVAEGKNVIGKPDEIQLIKAVDKNALANLFKDSELLKLLPIREDGVKKMTYFSGSIDPLSETDLSSEVFGVAFFHFKENGREGLRNFESEASVYFEKYGLELNYIQTPETKTLAIGNKDIPLPDEIQLLTTRTQKELNALFVDKGFNELLPLRAKATNNATFFLGKKLY